MDKLELLGKIKELVDFAIKELMTDKKPKLNPFRELIKERIIWTGNYLYIGNLQIGEITSVGVDMYAVRICDGKFMYVTGSYSKAREVAENYACGCLSAETDDD